jgi:hypothetical protein
MRNTVLHMLLLFGFPLCLQAQDSAETPKNYKNTFRINVSNPIIFGKKSIVFGYERVLNNRQSISVNFGKASFPAFSLVNSDSLKSSTTLSDKGVNFSIDYRFYLAKENKYSAPRGVYIGPYYSYNFVEKKNSWSLTSTSGGSAQVVESTTSMRVHGVGFELGYQFIFWNRVSLDMILVGPGIAGYNLKAAVAENLSAEDKKKFFEKLNQALADKLPGYSLVIDEGEFEKNGTVSSTSFGFRYMLLLGFRF